MYVLKTVYSGCCRFRDIEGKGTCSPNALFDLTKDYYYVIPRQNAIKYISEQVPMQENQC